MAKRYIGIVVFAVVCLAAAILMRTNQHTARKEYAEPRSQSVLPDIPSVHPAISPSNTITPPASVSVVELPIHPLTRSFGTSAFPPEREPEILLEIFDAYRRATGSYPIAEDNRNMMYILTGGQNERGGVFPRDHARINQRGELTDGWGTPFYFHCISSTHIEIRSAGPDAEFYTPDDLIVPERPLATPL